MLKRFVPLLLSVVAFAFTTGLVIGARNEADLQLARQAIQRHIGTTIAVVNADRGVYINGNVYNYAAAIIDNLGDDFVLVSPAMAETGFNSGLYAAIVTFPGDVSTRVLSFNAHMPERVRLEFQINPALSEPAFLETYMAITDLQLSINTTLANTYIASILRQFHDAQDQVEGVFQNNLSDLMALELLTLHDFTYNLQFDALPVLPMELRELDTRFHMRQVSNFAENVSNLYLHSYALASDSFLWMREGLFGLTYNFRHQEEAWLRELADWTNHYLEFGELVEAFAAEVRGHEYYLQEWYSENVYWRKELQIYSDEVHGFHNENLRWLEEALAWHHEYVTYLTMAREFSDEIRAYRQLLYESIQPVKEDMTAWFDSLTNYETGLSSQFEALLTVIEDHNLQSEITNEFLIYLLDWHSKLEDSQYDLTVWQDNINNRLTDLNEWQFEFQNIQESWEADVKLVINDIYHFNIPERFSTEIDLDEYMDYLEQIIFDKPYLPSNPVGNLGVPSINISSSVPFIPSVPGADYDNWEGFLESLNVAVSDLSNWSATLSAANSELLNWNSNLVDETQNLNNWSASLSGFYYEVEQIFTDVYEWSYKITDFSYNLFMLGIELTEYQELMEAWHEELKKLYYTMTALESPELPHYSQFEYLYQLEEILADIPDGLEPLEQVLVPKWDAEILPPGGYTGAEIEGVFAREFPVDNEALSYEPTLRPIVDEGNRQLPYGVGDHDVLFAHMPESPLQEPPPRAYDFWASLGDMHGQLLEFNVEDFLGEDIQAQVSNSLAAFDSYLETVRQDASFQFEYNIWQLEGVRREYRHFLENMGRNALSAQFQEQQALRYSMDQFADARTATGDNTRFRLSYFANMMPESRAAGGINQRLVNFIAAPFDFVPIGLRDEVNFDYLVLAESMEDQYNIIQQVVSIVAAIVLILTIFGNFLYVRLRKNSTEGAEN